ncbi:MAG TPA: type II secretion system F family protein [Clostridiaceae bacterium]|jgi:type IV pilus assembly protein PilC|nr:type II secretion system F family protein [Clostridiaceae bacterium]
MKKRVFSAMELSLLCHQMEQFFKSGVSPLEGIPVLSEEITNARLKKSMEFISEKIIEGMSLYQAFLEEGSFPDYMLQMIRIGELTGKLDTVMENLSVYYENESDLNKEIKNAITYPVILSLLIIGIIGLMIYKVIPVFDEIFQGLGGQMPKEAQVILLFTISLKKIFLWFLIISVFVILIIIIFAKTKKGKLVFDEFKVKNPVTGLLYRKVISYRIGMGLDLTIQSGMNTIDSFNLVKGLIDNKYVANVLEGVSQNIANGESFSDAIKDSKVFPELFSRMIKTGERTGKMNDTIKKLTRIYGKESEISLKRFSKTIEPALVAILSVILGMVLLSVLLPLIGIMSSIG